MEWKKIAYRALKTFVQAALSVVVVSELGYLNVGVWEAAAVAGGAALLAFIYNLVTTWEP